MLKPDLDVSDCSPPAKASMIAMRVGGVHIAVRQE
jgi:hypothetical protein